MPKIPTLDKINTATDVPCVRKGCKALSKARCISPEGVPSPRAHSPRQYLFGYLTLGTMPDKPTSMTDAEKEAADKLAQDYLGEMVVPPTELPDDLPAKVDEPKDDAERIQDALDEIKVNAPAEEPPVAPGDHADLTDEQRDMAVQASLTRLLSMANPSDMLATMIRAQNITEPQAQLDLIGEHRVEILEIMNLMNELEVIDYQRQALMDLFEEVLTTTREKILAIIKTTETPSPEVPQPVTTG